MTIPVSWFQGGGMRHQIMLSFYGLIFSIAAFSMSASAVSLGKIDVASHLGEPFYAEVPLDLDEGEVISSVFVELAAPIDYRILEVYRDETLNAVRADVESDSRGSRIELTSSTVLDAPFFNLVLKVRYGRATHYKKYPVFLDLPRAAQSVKTKVPLPTVSVDDVRKEPVVATVSAVKGMQGESRNGNGQTERTSDDQSSTFKSFEGWARTSHYGPMVYGDTISTVADRLRIDARYSRNQVMVALFEKNRDKFAQDNVNLIQAGTHLDVPLAEEVERIRPDQARSIIKEHDQRWRELVKQPRYAAVAEAQKTRYSKRVHMGKRASGAASAPVSEQQEQSNETSTKNDAGGPTSPVSKNEGSVDAVEGQADVEVSAMAESISKLQKDNEALQAELAESDAKLAKLSAAGPIDEQVAVKARNKKLELELARLQAELDDSKQSAVEGPGPDWLMLLGGGLVILLLGGGAGYLMRRERQHPAMNQGDTTFASNVFEDIPMEPAAPEEIEVEAVEEFSPDSTSQMNTDEFEDAFTDSIPDLTDEETGEMEAFKDDQEEEPDPNVDYLSEADVYMRYGMEEEAEKQVSMALKLRENNKDALVKLVQIRKARGDTPGADEAISTARMVLSGEALGHFDASIEGVVTGESPVEEVSLEDTLPPGALDVSSDPQVEEGLEDASDVSDLGDIEFESEEVSSSEAEMDVPVEAGELEGEKSETLGLNDIEWPSEDTSEDVAVQESTEKKQETLVEEPAPSDTAGLDFDLSGLELPDDSASAAGVSEEAVEVAESIETVTGTASELASEVASEAIDNVQETMEDDGLSLSDLDFTDDETGSDVTEHIEEPKEELMTADLDKTVVMDWSKETVSPEDYDASGESGAGEIEIDFGQKESLAEEDGKTENGVEAESEPKEHLTSIEFDLDDLDVDLDEPVSSDDLDDFSSTIQTSIDEIKKESASGAVEGDVEESEAIDFDLDESLAEEDTSFGLEPLDEETAVEIDGASSDSEDLGDDSLALNIDNEALENLIEKSEDKDFDATLELDSLLSELGDLDEEESSSDKDKDVKKGDS